MPAGHMCVFFGKIMSILNGLFIFCVEIYLLFIYFGYELLIRYIIFKYLLPFNKVPFGFVDSFLGCAKAFHFGVIPMI